MQECEYKDGNAYKDDYEDPWIIFFIEKYIKAYFIMR